MTDRQRLTKLLDDNVQCNGVLGIESCDTCPYRYNENCYTEALVTHLISNGVTFYDDTNPKWIPVSERLPDISDNYLVVIVNGIYRYTDKMYYHEGWWYDREGEVTHWKPMPSLPKEG